MLINYGEVMIIILILILVMIFILMMVKILITSRTENIIHVGFVKCNSSEIEMVIFELVFVSTNRKSI